MPPVSLDSLNSASEADFIAALGDIFEHAPWVAATTAGQRPFATLEALYQAMTRAVRDATADRQVELIVGHPDLAGKAARAGEITAASRAEQSSAGLDSLTDQQYDAFHRWNAAYRAKFAMPFIVCVRRHTKESILAQCEQRLNNTPAQEHEAALEEIFRIAALRLDERVAAPERLKVHGRLSTHVLDTQAGRPGQGIPVELVEISYNERRIVGGAVTNADGRTNRPLIEGRPLPIGVYELSFQVATYFAAQKARLDKPAFLDTIPIRFAIAEPEGHYHVPLLVTPWSYTTYRGS